MIPSKSYKFPNIYGLNGAFIRYGLDHFTVNTRGSVMAAACRLLETQAYLIGNFLEIFNFPIILRACLHSIKYIFLLCQECLSTKLILYNKNNVGIYINSTRLRHTETKSTTKYNLIATCPPYVPRAHRGSPREETPHESVDGKYLITLEESGEPCRIRTCDPLIKSQLLYQLS